MPRASVGFLAFPAFSVGRVGKPGWGCRRPEPEARSPKPVLSPSVGFLAFSAFSVGRVGKPGVGTGYWVLGTMLLTSHLELSPSHPGLPGLSMLIPLGRRKNWCVIARQSLGELVTTAGCIWLARRLTTEDRRLSYRIFFPNADSASSTARSAVRLCSSMTGFTSTISKLVMRPWSAMISIARCASR